MGSAAKVTLIISQAAAVMAMTMNAHVQLPETTVGIDWKPLALEVNAWRGACMQDFAQAEMAVSETLHCLSKIDAFKPHIRLRHLVGQRFQDLADALSSDVPTGRVGLAAGKALTEFRLHESLRVHLAHGDGTLAMKRAGKWLTIFRHTHFKAGERLESVLVIERDEEALQLKKLRQDRQRLCDTLRNLRAAQECAR